MDERCQRLTQPRCGFDQGIVAMMNFANLQAQNETRRHFLKRCPIGLGAMALAAMPSSSTPAQEVNTTRPARAKSVIYLHMAGSPPQHDLFDYKPKLNEYNMKPCPDSFLENRRLPFIKGHPKLLGTPHQFGQHGETGQWISSVLPKFSSVIDRTAIVRSMYTDQFNHAPAQLLLYTGSPQNGRPSMGSWATYGLGSTNSNLPAFVVLISGGTDPSGGKSLWSSGFLPSVHQGVQCRSVGDPILYVSDPKGMSRATRRRTLDALRELNQLELEKVGDPEISTRIDQYELAYRMQMTVPEVMDIGKEPKALQQLYGAQPGKASFANNCLLARRLVEDGVRFVQLFDWGWDMHGTGAGNDLLTGLPKKCRDIDQPITALLTDLEQRGLLDETLVVWGGEFGRTSMNEERNGSKFLGRDHHPDCFTIWMAGGGVKPGITYGTTDELGYTVAERPVHVRDLQATILHLLGIDPHEFSVRYQGLDQRLIGPEAWPKVVDSVLA